MPNISVIMPSLNVAKYIAPCLESVINQTYTDLEILVIDAGSTDGTLEIVKSYADKDLRIKLIKSDKKSYGYQVNLGLNAANGEYIGFVDTDDILIPNAYELLHREIEKNDLDYVKGFAKIFWEMPDGTRGEYDIAKFFVKKKIQNQIIEPCKMPELVVEDHFLWLGLYSRKILNHVRLNETPGAAFQDQGFCMQVFCAAHRAMYVDQAVYLYRQDNAASSTYNRNGMRYIRNEYCLNLRFLKEKNDALWYSRFYERLWDQCRGRFEIMASSGEFWKDANEDIIILQEMLQDAIARGFLTKDILGTEKWNYLEIFLRNPEDLYAHYKADYTEQLSMLYAFLNQVKDKEVIIAGCGRWGSFLQLLLKKNGVQVKAYCDNNQLLWGTMKDGLMVLSLEEAAIQYKNKMFAVANKLYSQKIRKQLIEMDVLEDNIIIYTLGMNTGLLRWKDLNSSLNS